MKKTYKSWVIGLLLGFLAAPQITLNCFAAASGNYTDLLPIGAASDTTVISRGSGWALTTLPPTQTFGDALSRVVTTVYQATSSGTITGTTSASTFTAISGLTSVGSATFPTSWIATGRTIEVLMDGYYSTANPAATWNWQIKLGTTTILTTGAQTATANQTKSPFEARAIMTIATTGSTAGSVNGYFSMISSSGAPTMPMTPLIYSTYTITGVSCDLGTTSTAQNSVVPVITWSVSTASITVNNIAIRFLN